jgi:hypothetical protein
VAIEATLAISGTKIGGQIVHGHEKNVVAGPDGDHRKMCFAETRSEAVM